MTNLTWNRADASHFCTAQRHKSCYLWFVVLHDSFWPPIRSALISSAICLKH